MDTLAKKTEYLLFNIVVISGPLLAIIFYPNVQIPKLIPVLAAIFIPAVIFIIWDQLVTEYFWNFNPKYILGIKIFKLPVEEILFFITVPFACLFLWVNWQPVAYYNQIFSIPNAVLIAFLLLLTAIGLIFIYKKKYYSGLVIIFFEIVLLALIIVFPNLIFQKKLIFFLFPVTLLTFIFNGYLTARPVVTYNKKLKSNINIWTVPIEDFIYGLSLVLLNIAIYQKLI